MADATLLLSPIIVRATRLSGMDLAVQCGYRKLRRCHVCTEYNTCRGEIGTITQAIGRELRQVTRSGSQTVEDLRRIT